jgi:hypothetical protein
MNSSLALAAATIAAFSMVALPTAAFADKGCKNIKSRCAIQIGGRCDPVTGRWEYGQRYMAGGTKLAFDNCVQGGGKLTLERPRARRPGRVVRVSYARTYIACSELAIERGYSNRAPGKNIFMNSCLRARAAAASGKRS